MVDKKPLTLILEDPADDSPTAPTPCGKAKFQIDSRSAKKGDQRQLGDRRKSIRFEDDRRSGIDRRASAEKWDDSHSI